MSWHTSNEIASLALSPLAFASASSAGAWQKVARRAAVKFQTDHVSMIASGVAFRATLAIFPGIAVLVWVGSQFISSAELRSALLSVSGTMPQSVREVVERATSSQLARNPGEQSSLGFLGPLLAFAMAAWSANGGMKAMFIALNTIFDSTEARGFVRLAFLTLTFTGGALVLALLVIALIVAGPSILSLTGFSQALLTVWFYLRWPLLLAVSTIAVGLLYRYAPNREGGRGSVLTLGGIAAALALTGCSAAFSWFVGRFANLSVTYGSLSTVFAFMIWLWLSFTLVLAGAELDAAIARETAEGAGTDEADRKREPGSEGTAL